ncbi:hypothetical protein [uncultured Novosphingobium sp.]|uniref:hypothetical protein n=1 Tax=uncultured Novosphingobium sp. TaxID=292277 RepID=UPI002583F2C8|nr:hypothetical protein [uncultured Novosphingobium sp.]
MSRYIVFEGCAGGVVDAGSWLVSIPAEDTELLDWARNSGFELHHDPLDEQGIDQYSIVTDKRGLTLFKLTWGGSI